MVLAACDPSCSTAQYYYIEQCCRCLAVFHVVCLLLQNRCLCMNSKAQAQAGLGCLHSRGGSMLRCKWVQCQLGPLGRLTATTLHNNSGHLLLA
jgi:hypothetical protein